MKGFIAPVLVITTVVNVGLWQIYAHYKKILEKQYGITLKRIGTLRKILIYPIEGLQGMPVEKSFCSKYGLVCKPFKYYDEDNKTLVRDRSHVFFSRFKGKAITLNPGLVKMSNCSIWRLLFKKNEYALSDKLIFINYLGNKIRINPIIPEVPNFIAKRIENYVLQYLEVGLKTDHIKTAFEHKKLEEHIDGDGFESNFSSYMLMNLTSLNSLQNTFNRKDLSYENFLPNFVIECPKYEEFIEDKIKQLKIGDRVLFEKVIPCTHTKLIEVNTQLGLHFSGLFRALQSIRGLNKLHPRLSQSNAPVFGINLEIANENCSGYVHINDPVYASFQFDELSYKEQIKEIILYITGVL